MAALRANECRISHVGVAATLKAVEVSPRFQTTRSLGAKAISQSLLNRRSHSPRLSCRFGFLHREGTYGPP